MKKQHIIFSLLLLVIALGAFLRIISLGYQEVWYDEAFSGLLVRNDWSTMFSIIQEDVHPPIYYTLLKLWMTFAPQTDIALRIPSAVFGILLIPMVFLFTRTLYPRTHHAWVALAASTLIAINPFMIQYSQEARSYSLVAFLMTAAAYFFFRALHSSPLATNRYWIGWSISIALAFLSHYIASLGIVMFFIIWLWFVYTHHHVQQHRLRTLVKQHLWTLLPAAILFMLWLPFLAHQLRVAEGLFWIPQAQLSFLFRSIAAFLYGVHHHQLAVPSVYELSTFISSKTIGFLIALCILPLTIYIQTARPKEITDRIFYIFLLWIGPIIGVMLLSFAGVQWYVERYMIEYGVFFLIFLCVLLAEYRKWLLGVALAVYAVSLLLVPVIPNRECVYECTIQSVDVPIQRMVATDPFDFFLIRYYLPTTHVVLYDEGNNDYTTWDMVNDDEVLRSTTQLRETDLIFTTRDQKFIITTP